MNKLFYTVLCMSFILFSCSDSDTIPSEPDSHPDHSVFYVFIGEVVYIYLNEDPINFTIKSDDPNIVASLGDDRWVKITAKGAGSALLTVYNSNDKPVATAFVLSSYFGSPGIEEITNHPALKSEVFVEVQQQEVKAIIENQLWDEIKDKKRTNYTFDSETLKYTMGNERTGEKQEGTYEWDINSLTLKHNGVVEKYGFKVDQRRRNYIIQEDRTEAYRQKYPEAGVIDVRLNRIWYDHYWPGILGMGNITIGK